jgi:gag-polyprotein putative aspartyl protease
MSIEQIRLLARFVSICLLLAGTSCGTTTSRSPATPARPADLPMSDRAGQGMPLVISLRLGDGQEFRCLLDTGAQGTSLPASLQSVLGSPRGRRRLIKLDGGTEVQTVFSSPPLTLGGTPVRTGDTVGVSSSETAVLGMDCLRHYCIQLDFESRRIRFLDPDALETDVSTLGDEYQLNSRPIAWIPVPGILQKRGSKLIVDTGDAVDGRVPVEVLQTEVRRGNAKTIPLLADGPVPPGLIPPMLFPTATWEGRIYRDVLIGPGPDLLSLRFLGRFRRVTFNFPKGRLYLDSGTE